jgi:glycine oxidase
MQRDVVILGGGIVGLSIAREAAREGLSTVVLERDRLGAHASGAAAGLLVSRAVVRSEVPARTFYTRSLENYPNWVGELERESGLSVPLHTGDDWCFFCPCARAERFHERLLRESDPSRWEEVDHLPKGLEGRVAPGRFRIFRFREERWVKPIDLLPALRDAAFHWGAQIWSEVGVPAVERLDGGGFRVLLEDRAFETPNLVVAAGPWSGGILAEMGWSANLVPVRGQMVLVPRLHDLQALVHLEDSFYVVPRGEFSVVGATSEHGQWEETTTPDGMADLHRRLGLLFPAFDPAQALERWSGIRPRTRDRVPHLGWLEPGLMVASGHYRSGVSMAPLTGRVATDLLRGLEPSFAITDLDPHRRPGGYRRIS